MKQTILGKWYFIVILVGSFLLSSCATVQEVLHVVSPKVAFSDVHCTGLSFEAVDLAVDVTIENPNPVPINLAGFDYDLKINDTSFLKGQQDNRSAIAAKGKSTLQIPVTLNYQDLYDTFKTLKQADNTAYQFAGGISFDLPVIGPTRIPFSKQGEFPTVKIPDINVNGLRVKKLSLAGAEIELELGIKNPNPFVLLLNRVDYELTMNDNPWIGGIGQKQAQIGEKNEATIDLGMSLNLEQIGTTVYQALAKKKPLNYHLRGNLNFGTSLPLLKQATIPLDRSGQLNILR
jgi:LEA14-like dessication related protein